MKRLWLSVLSAGLALVPGAEEPPAFPGAEGFGARATGGRGGGVYPVTNLNDDGPGSFRDAVRVGKRIVVFEVGGYIELKSPVHIASDITIAGQTAPGDGIGTKNFQVSFSNSRNIIVRYIRFRGGLAGSRGQDAASISKGENMIFDHVSVSWGRDENFSINNSRNITVQNSIIAEGLVPHSAGGLVQSPGVSLIRNLYIHNHTRNPKAKGQLQFVNNVVYNWGIAAFIEGDSAGRSEANVQGNYFIAGPSTKADAGPFTRGNLNFNIHAAGNYFVDARNGSKAEARLTTLADLGTVTVRATPFPFPPVTVLPGPQAYRRVLATAGASRRRDAIDARLVADVQNRTGGHISDPATVGGFGTLNSGVAPADRDRDGMPDAWEIKRGLNPNKPTDANAVAGSTGYTNVETYLNELVDSAAT
jgi:pectate lyase